MAGTTVERARGRWRELLPRLGCSPKFLVNRHGPCPMCGGRDRFRWDNRDGSGSFYCNQCGPGTGIVLVQRINGWTFKEAADAIDELLGDARIAARKPVPTTSEGPSPSERLDRLQRLLSEANDPSLVREYLARRGLSTFPDVLLGHQGLPYYDGDGKFICNCPAMVAPVHGPDGTLQSVHRTYIGRSGTRKKLTSPVETVTGGAIRLFEHGDVLGVAEGIETAVACCELFSVPTWAVISATLMEGWHPPAGVSEVIVFADNDANFAGQKAAYRLANRLALDGYEVAVKVPPVPGTDFLDVLLSEGAADVG